MMFLRGIVAYLILVASIFAAGAIQKLCGFDNIVLLDFVLGIAQFVPFFWFGSRCGVFTLGQIVAHSL